MYMKAIIVYIYNIYIYATRLENCDVEKLSLYVHIKCNTTWAKEVRALEGLSTNEGKA